MRTSTRALNSVLKEQLKKTFAQTLVDLKTPKEVLEFFDNFFTESELETYTKRLAVAYWLKKGRSYSNIKENLKVSSATIASAQSSLESPGIELALKKMEAEEWANQWSDKIKKFVGS